MQETTKKRLVVLASLAGLNILLSNSVIGDGQQLSGEVIPAHSPEMRRAAITTYLVGLQVISGILAMFVALVPYQKRRYQAKAETYTLLIAIGLQAFFFIGSLVKIGIKLLG